MNFFLYIAGFLFSIFVGHWLTSFVMQNARRYEENKKTWKKTRKKRNNDEKYEKFPQAIGCVERLIYTASWILNVKQFIGVWLALKAIGVWSEGLKAGWAESEDGISKRVRYYSFLLGTSLSLLFGIAGGLLIEKGQNDQWVSAVLYTLLLVCGSLYLGRWFQKSQ